MFSTNHQFEFYIPETLVCMFEFMPSMCTLSVNLDLDIYTHRYLFEGYSVS